MSSINIQLRSTPSIEESDYESLAAVYYDARLHPTCHALREGSAAAIRQLLGGAASGGTAVEVGAGKAILPECLPDWERRFKSLILLDSSKSMLDHSSHLIGSRTTFLLREAATTGLPAGSADLLVASLGDPYNEPGFWKEVRRLLRPSGVAVFTTPSCQWAGAFRRAHQRAPEHSAEFVLPDSRIAYVPSLIYDRSRQEAMIRLADLRVDATVAVTRLVLPSADEAPKLRAVAADVPFLEGYLISVP